MSQPRHSPDAHKKARSMRSHRTFYVQFNLSSKTLNVVKGCNMDCLFPSDLAHYEQKKESSFLEHLLEHLLSSSNTEKDLKARTQVVKLYIFEKYHAFKRAIIKHFRDLFPRLPLLCHCLKKYNHCCHLVAGVTESAKTWYLFLFSQYDVTDCVTGFCIVSKLFLCGR